MPGDRANLCGFRQASAAACRRVGSAHLPTAARVLSPGISFLGQIPASHAEGSCCAPRRSAPGWPRAASCRPCPVPAFHGSEHRALAPPGLPRPPLTNADYWRFADWLAPYFDAVWVPEKNLYGSGNSGVGRIYHNSLLLTTHAVAALTGHQGPCRNDERARALARRLCDSPPWSERDASPEGDPQFHNPGWVESMGTREAAMDKSIDPKVAEALMYAWRARDVLRLPQETVDLIADRVNRCARGPFFRFPNVRLNQLNWNCELYAHAATITGNPELLVNDYRAQVVRFCDGITEGGASRRLTEPRPRIPLPLPPAPAADPPLQPRQRGVRERDGPLHPLLRAGARGRHGTDRTGAGEPAASLGGAHRVRVLDPRRLSELGHGLRVQALARGPHVGPGAAGPARDRGQPRASTHVPSWACGPSTSSTAGWPCTSASRRLPPTARASRRRTCTTSTSPRSGPASGSCSPRGCRRTRSEPWRSGWVACRRREPPPLYSFDGDIGRLAVTTKHYSTAVLPVSQRAFPYGGLELCRLYDGDQRVVSNVGGRPWASFGVLVRQRGKEIATSQRPRRSRRCARRCGCCPPHTAASTWHSRIRRDRTRARSRH